MVVDVKVAVGVMLTGRSVGVEVGMIRRVGTLSFCVDGTTVGLGIACAAQAPNKIHNIKTHKFFISISISKKRVDVFMLNFRA
jgi:hypothetical protein